MSSYAQLADLYNVAPQAMFGSLTAPQLQSCLDGWSNKSDSILGARARLPWVVPPPALVRVIAELAAYDAVMLRGFDPNSGSDVNFRVRAIGLPGQKDGGALGMLWSWGRGEGQLVGGVEAPADQPAPVYPAPLVVSQPLQGWNPDQGGGGTGSSGVF